MNKTARNQANKKIKRAGMVKVIMKRHCPITKRGRWMEVWVKESSILEPMPF